MIGSILLASTDLTRLHDWYERAFGLTANTDGFLRFGDVAVLIDGRDDVAAQSAEPARVILTLHVHDARATAARLDAIGVTWVSEVEYRETTGAWFGTGRCSPRPRKPQRHHPHRARAASWSRRRAVVTRTPPGGPQPRSTPPPPAGTWSAASARTGYRSTSPHAAAGQPAAQPGMPDYRRDSRAGSRC